MHRPSRLREAGSSTAADLRTENVKHVLFSVYRLHVQPIMCLNSLGGGPNPGTRNDRLTPRTFFKAGMCSIMILRQAQNVWDGRIRLVEIEKEQENGQEETSLVQIFDATIHRIYSLKSWWRKARPATTLTLVLRLGLKKTPT